MAQRYYTLPIRDASFPMLSEKQGRTIIGGSEAAAEGDQDPPSLSFCHNVMPTIEGLDSVGYTSAIPAALPAATNFTDARIIHSVERNLINIAWDTDGRAYVLEEGDTVWRTLPDTVPPTILPTFDISDVTMGTVNGITYILYKGIAAFIYYESTHTLTEVVLTGIITTALTGLTASSGYLIAYTEIAIAWSSLITPVDFAPSQVTGAGGGLVSGIQGGIQFILPNSLGILIYAHANIIAGTYTGNAQYPFKLREVTSSKGGVSLDLVAYEANSAAQFTFSQVGLQTVTSKRAELFLPEITDFLGGKVFEDFDEVTKELTLTDLTATMKKKIKFVGSRYIIISYGITSFTHALIYDIGLERLGKLKVDHVDCFEYLGSQTEVSKENIAFLLNTGEIKTLDFSTTSSNSNGVVILGKLQYTRGRTITLQGVDVENIYSAASLSVTSAVSLDGKTVNKTEGVE